MSLLSWMAWTPPVVIFFVCIGVLLVAMTVWEVRSPTVARRGLLPLVTTRVDRLLIQRRQSTKRFRNLFRHVADCAVDAKPGQQSAAVAQIDRFATSRRGPGRRNGPPACAVRQNDFGFDGRTAPRIPHTPADDLIDRDPAGPARFPVRRRPFSTVKRFEPRRPRRPVTQH